VVGDGGPIVGRPLLDFLAGAALLIYRAGVYQIGEVYARSCVTIGTLSGMSTP